MKFINILLALILISIGCKSKEIKERSKHDKIRQINFPIYASKECDSGKEIIGMYEFNVDDYLKDSVQIAIHVNGKNLDEYELDLIKDSSLKDKLIYMHDNNAYLPISFKVPPYNGEDTLNMIIYLDRPHCKTITKTNQIIYYEKSDTLKFINYDNSTKMVKFGSKKRFPSANKPLKKGYGYKINYETLQTITRNPDSINFSIYLRNSEIFDPLTGEKMKFRESPRVSHNYPLHYDLTESMTSYYSNKTPFEVTHNTGDSIDSYPGYIFYFDRLGQNISAVAKECNQLDTLSIEDVWIPGMLKPSFVGKD